MTSRGIVFLSLLALCAFVAMVTMADAEEVGLNTDLQTEKRRSLEVLHLEKRAAGEELGEETTGRKKRKRGRGGKDKGKGKGKGKGKNRGPPVYERCINHNNGLECTCDMRFEKFRNHPTKQMKFYTIC